VLACLRAVADTFHTSHTPDHAGGPFAELLPAVLDLHLRLARQSRGAVRNACLRFLHAWADLAIPRFPIPVFSVCLRSAALTSEDEALLPDAPYDFWATAYGDEGLGRGSRALAQALLRRLAQKKPRSVHEWLMQAADSPGLDPEALVRVIATVAVVMGECPWDLVDPCLALLGAQGTPPLLRLACAFLAAETLPQRPAEFDPTPFLTLAGELLVGLPYQPTNEVPVLSGTYVVHFTIACALLAGLVKRMEIPGQFVGLALAWHGVCATDDAIAFLCSFAKRNGEFASQFMPPVAESLLGELDEQRITRGDLENSKPRIINRMFRFLTSYVRGAAPGTINPAVLLEMTVEYLKTGLGRDSYIEDMISLEREFVGYACRSGFSPLDVGVEHLLGAWVEMANTEAFVVEMGHIILVPLQMIDLDLQLCLASYLLGVWKRLTTGCDSIDRLACVTVFCRILQAFHNHPNAGQFAEQLDKGMNDMAQYLEVDDKDRQMALMALLELEMSREYTQCPFPNVSVTEIVRQWTLLRGFYSNYHRRLFLWFLEVNGLAGDPLFAATLNGVDALGDLLKEELALVRMFDKYPDLLPQFDGFVSIPTDGQ
jgi:hypothetical protein